MSEHPFRIVKRVLAQAQDSDEVRHKKVAAVGLSPQMARLRKFQSGRIAATYADFAEQSQYSPVMDFFLEDLYGPRDFTQRDYDAVRAYNFLKKLVPVEMLKLATDANELILLSNRLDEELLRALVEQTGVHKTITDAQYSSAYRHCHNVAARRRQIELLMGVMSDSAATARMPLTGPLLKMAKAPAHAAGWHELYGFIERGHAAFARVKKPQVFLDAIRERETKILKRLMRGDKAPFEV